jgi:TonB family protein
MWFGDPSRRLRLMPFKHAARHFTTRSRLAHRRIRLVLARATAAQVIGPATVAFAALSLVSHALVTWFTVTYQPARLPDASSDSLVTTRFLYPLMQQRPRPLEERVHLVGVGGKGASKVASAPVAASEGEMVGEAVDEDILAAEPIRSEPADAFDSFSELEVDETAERDPESEGPSYPDSLLARRVEGEARVRFVIDTTGRAIPESFAVITSNHAGFGAAVREALPRMKFKPASMGRKPVAQRVEQTFVFKITPPPAVPQER